MKKIIMNLRLFDGGNDAGAGGNGGQGGTGGNGSQGNAGGATYTYEQAEQIATARAERAERSALKSFFQQQGLSEAEINTAISDYKKTQASKHPDVSAVEAERDAAKAELEDLKNEKVLTGKGVRSEDLDYVLFKVKALVDDKTDFAAAADKFLKDNPRYSGQGTYRVTTQAASGSDGGNTNVNQSINDVIRRRARR